MLYFNPSDYISQFDDQNFLQTIEIRDPGSPSVWVKPVNFDTATLYNIGFIFAIQPAESILYTPSNAMLQVSCGTEWEDSYYSTIVEYTHGRVQVNSPALKTDEGLLAAFFEGKKAGASFYEDCPPLLKRSWLCLRNILISQSFTTMDPIFFSGEIVDGGLNINQSTKHTAPLIETTLEDDVYSFVGLWLPRDGFYLADRTFNSLSISCDDTGYFSHSCTSLPRSLEKFL